MSTKDEQKRIDEILERMRAATNSKNDAQLASWLGVARSVVSAWKSRGNTPYAQCGQICEATGVSMDWLLTGAGEKQRDSEPLPDLSRQARIVLSLMSDMTEEQQDNVLRRVQEQKQAREKDLKIERLEKMVGELLAAQRSA